MVLMCVFFNLRIETNMNMYFTATKLVKFEGSQNVPIFKIISISLRITYSIMRK